MPKNEKNEGSKLKTKSFTHDGKRYFCRAKTQEEANANAAILENDLKSGKKLITKHMLCKDWLEQYMEVYRRPSIVMKTYKEERSLWNVHIAPTLQNLTLSEARALHCKTVLINMAEKGRKKDHLSKARTFMKGFFRAAIENGLLIENPAENLKLPVCEEDGSHRNITPDERSAFLQACDVIPYPCGLWAKIMLYCGARPDEATRVRGEHIDVKGRRLFIDGTKTRTNAAKRWVPIPDVFLPELEPYAQEKSGKKATPLILKNEHEGKISKTNRKRMWERFRKEMHVILGGETDYGKLRRVPPKEDGSWKYLVAEDFVPYCLRHTFCTDLAKAGVPLVTAAKYMGHVNINMVSKIYTHVDAEMDADAARMINEYLNRPKGKVIWLSDILQKKAAERDEGDIPEEE